MSLLTSAKAKVTTGNMKEAFKNEAGAIDLASIMVGIIVIGLIGGVIAATVFAVIPWAQDNAAKQQLDSVAAAQSAYIGLSSDTPGAISFGTVAQLKAANLFDADTAKVKIAQDGTGDAAHFVAVKKSASGQHFYITDNKTQATKVAAAPFGSAGATLPGGTAINGTTFGTGVTPGPQVNVTWNGTL